MVAQFYRSCSLQSFNTIGYQLNQPFCTHRKLLLRRDRSVLRALVRMTRGPGYSPQLRCLIFPPLSPDISAFFRQVQKEWFDWYSCSPSGSAFLYDCVHLKYFLLLFSYSLLDFLSFFFSTTAPHRGLSC